MIRAFGILANSLWPGFCRPSRGPQRRKGRLPNARLFPVDFAPSTAGDHSPDGGAHDGKRHRRANLDSVRTNAAEARAGPGGEPNAQANPRADSQADQGISFAMTRFPNSYLRDLLPGEHLLPLAGSQRDCVIRDPLDLAADGARAGRDPHFGTGRKRLNRTPSRGDGLRVRSRYDENETRRHAINPP